MMRVSKTAKKVICQSAENIRKAKNLYDEKPTSTKAFIADAKKSSESYQRIQNMRKTIESK